MEIMVIIVCVFMGLIVLFSVFNSISTDVESKRNAKRIREVEKWIKETNDITIKRNLIEELMVLKNNK